MKHRLASLLIALLIPIALLPLWMQHLDADPPAYLSGRGQSFSTDPYIYTYHARNEQLFASAEPLGDLRYQLFSPTLIAQAARLWFSNNGVSITSANQIGVVLSLMSLAFILAALAMSLSWWQLLLAAIPLATSQALFHYARVPFLENGLLVIASATFLAIRLTEQKSWWWIVAAIGVAAATVFGKSFGLLLLPAVAATAWIKGDRRTFTEPVKLLVLGAAAVGCFALIAYGGAISDVSATISRIPPGWVQPFSYIDTFISFGAASKLYVADPLLLFCMLTLLLAISIRIGWEPSRLAHLPVHTLVALFWTLFVWIGLVPLTYAPHRYALLLIPGVVAAWGLIYGSPALSSFAERSWLNVCGVGLVVWIAIVQGAYLFHFQFAPHPPFMAITWVCAPVAALGAFVAHRLWNSMRSFAGRPLTILSIAGVIALGGLQAYTFWKSSDSPIITTTRDASFEIAELLGKEAVISGSYATPLVMENNLPALIYFLIDKDPFDSLLSRFPITHLAINKDGAEQLYTSLKGRSPIATFWLRDYEVVLYSVFDLSGHPKARAYQPTTYELAAAAMNAGLVDSAARLIEAAPASIRSTRNGGLLYGGILRSQNRLQEAAEQYQTLARTYQSDFSVQIECGNFLQVVGLGTKDDRLVSLSAHYFERSAILNPYRADFANQLYGENLRRFGRVR